MVEVTRIIHLLDVMLPPEQVTTEPLISAVVSGKEHSMKCIDDIEGCEMLRKADFTT